MATLTSPSLTSLIVQLETLLHNLCRLISESASSGPFSPYGTDRFCGPPGLPGPFSNYEYPSDPSNDRLAALKGRINL